MKKIIIGIIFLLAISSAAALCPCMEDSKISSLEKQVNDSINKSLEIEQQIEGRSFFIELFYGSDWELAGQLKNETLANRERISELKELANKDYKEIEKENEQLYILSVMQGNMRGLFGWFKR